MKKYYVTTPIYYINDRAHIGHVYCTMAADIAARYKRSMGYDVMFLTGTDENATKVERAAQAAGTPTKEFVDNLAAAWKEYFADFDLTHNRFIRTTDADHIKAAQTVMTRLFEKSFVYKGSYEGLYCVPCETYFNEADLKDGNCPDCGRPVEKVKEENYFFKLTAFRDKLLKHFEDNPDFVLPKKRYNEVLSVIKEGLRDVSFTRTGMDWGIKVPFDEKHTIYVWADALTNYLTAVGFPDDEEKFNKYWPADVHLVGKDIIRFHCIIWPAMLMALDLPLPKHIYAHGWWTVNAEKVSKSKGNIVRPHEEVADLIAAAGVTEPLAKDAFRYFIFRELPFGDDGDFSQENFFGRYNADLANDLGNLLNRTQKMVQKNFDSIVPNGKILPEIQKKFDEVLPEYHAKLEQFKFSQALEFVWEFVNALNTSIEVHKPWELKKEGKEEELGNLLYTLLDGIRVTSSLLLPFIPETANIFAKSVNLDSPPNLDSLKLGDLASGAAIEMIDVMFPRIDLKKLKKESKAEVKAEKKEAKEEQKKDEDDGLMSIEDFMKFKFRIGKVLEVEPVPKADKLLKVQVDLGDEKRQIVAGIAQWYKPEDLVGKTIVVVANLKPAKLRGVVSEGMLMAATGSEYVAIVSPEKPVEPGSVVK